MIINNYLTQEQVDNLPNGTKVNIKWSGGTGAGEYTITGGKPKYTLDSFGIIMKDPLTFVGLNSFNTKVWIK